MKSAAGFHILRIFGRLVGLHALVALQSGCLTKPLQAAEVACQDLFGNPVYCLQATAFRPGVEAECSFR